MIEVIAVIVFALIFGLAIARKKNKQGKKRIGKYSKRRSHGVEHDNGLGDDGGDSGSD
ncbi:hypothetical protein [Oceanospirillum beijerinckii]|uniref:hypothetical protein n=1 Tax=Oceanospirillum beijerinckii TaxID=64976 RepID=UPI000404083B|nr:hypothetical protein [Oceanospirillum beijerinckii]